jgi:hypothetical protein
VAPNVRRALTEGLPVVALESTIISHGKVLVIVALRAQVSSWRALCNGTHAQLGANDLRQIGMFHLLNLYLQRLPFQLEEKRKFIGIQLSVKA